MRPKPVHLNAGYAGQFKDASIVRVYHTRPPYASETFDILVGLISDEARTVLDVGCGTGELARPLAARVERVDAVDFSANMIERGRHEPGGDSPNLVWQVAAIETATLNPPYALIIAGDSLHWMDWTLVFDIFADALTPNGYLALVTRSAAQQPWDKALGAALTEFSTNRDYQPFNLVDELTSRNLFQIVGEQTTAPVLFRQSIADYIESVHSRNGFSRDRMTQEAASSFDEHTRDILAPYALNDEIELTTFSQITWGKPLVTK